MARPCCVHVQEGWVRPKPASLTHSSSESAWQHRALLSMRTVSQTMLMVGTASVAQACIAAFTHNIYPASCKSHLSLLLNIWVLWFSLGEGKNVDKVCLQCMWLRGAHTTPPAQNMSRPILAEDNRANVTRQKTIPNHFIEPAVVN